MCHCDIHVDGHMVSIETGESFKFEVRKGDKKYNQKHYEALGEVRLYIIYLMWLFII